MKIKFWWERTKTTFRNWTWKHPTGTEKCMEGIFVGSEEPEINIQQVQKETLSPTRYCHQNPGQELGSEYSVWSMLHLAPDSLAYFNRAHNFF